MSADKPWAEGEHVSETPPTSADWAHTVNPEPPNFQPMSDTGFVHYLRTNSPADPTATGRKLTTGMLGIDMGDLTVEGLYDKIAQQAKDRAQMISKHLTTAEAAAEYWCSEWRIASPETATSVKVESHRRAEILYRFATLPHAEANGYE